MSMSKAKIINHLLVLFAFIPISAYAESDINKYINDTIPSQWTYSSEFSQTIPTEDQWWKSFNDPKLDTLISIGVQNNYNVLMAQKRMMMAKAAIGQAKSYYMPSFGFSAGWVKARTAGDLNSANTPVITSDYFSLGINMSWQIDLFGQITKQVQQSKAQWQASRSQYEGAMVTLCGNIAATYINLRTYQTELQVATRHAASQKIVCDITQARFESGLASKLDVAQAQMVYYSTIASIPTLSAAIENNICALAILIGEYPSQLKSSLFSLTPPMEYRQIVSVGVPMQLLRRRPDITEAEYNLAAAAASVGIAKKDFLPVLSIDGSVGFEAHKLGNLFKDDAFNYTVQPKLTWTIFNGLERKYALASAKDQLQMEIDNYNSTIMTAYQDVEAAMNNYKYSLLCIDAYQKAMDQSKTALDLSIDLYKKGLSSFTNVMDAMMSYLQYNNSTVTAQGNALTSLVSLYEALGGGWQTTTQDTNNK